MKYMKYYSRKNVAGSLFNEDSAKIILPLMVNDYIFILSDRDTYVKETDFFVPEITDLFPTSKIINPNVECLFYDVNRQHLEIWIENLELTSKEISLGDIINLDIFI